MYTENTVYIMIFDIGNVIYCYISYSRDTFDYKSEKKTQIQKSSTTKNKYLPNLDSQFLPIAESPSF